MRIKLTLTYVGFVMIAVTLLLVAVWVFLLRGYSVEALVPEPSDFRRAIDPHNFGPAAFGAAAVLVLAFSLVLGLVGGWFVAGRMLAPLARITDATRMVTSGSLSHRIEMSGRSDEFGELADAFDSMLTRLEAHDSEQGRFAANASHELRTPLATMQALLDVAREDPSHDAGDLIERLHSVNARAIQLTEALLLLSRADQRAFRSERVDLSLVAEEASETLLALAERDGVTIETAGDVALAVGSPALLLQVAINLLHNAIVHNPSEDGFVRITTAVDAECAVLTVENSGDRLSPELVATLTEPFQRGTRRIRSDHAGVGLGLAIVKSVVQAHDGMLTITPRPSGGLCIKAYLPRWTGVPQDASADG